MRRIWMADSQGDLDTFYDYKSARNRSLLHAVSSLLARRKNALIPFEVVRAALGEDGESYLGRRQIAVTRIIGSEQRHHLFSAGFAPKKAVSRQRWMSVDRAMRSGRELPPITVFEVGGAYFVRDGNHRVSVARSQAVEFIEAEVTRLASRVSIPPGAGQREISALVSRAQEKRFSESTGLDTGKYGIRPTEPGGWDELIRDVERHRLFLVDEGMATSFREASASWFHTVYTPLVAVIRRLRLRRPFRRASSTDLYIRVAAWEEEAESRLHACFDAEDAAAGYREHTRRAARARLKARRMS